MKSTNPVVRMSIPRVPKNIAVDTVEELVACRKNILGLVMLV